MGKNNSKQSGSTAMAGKAAARIQRSTAKANGGAVPKGGFAARAQRAAVNHTKK